jgi:hypothetical protein
VKYFVVGAVLVASLAACSSAPAAEAPKGPEALGPDGLRGLTPGMALSAAAAGGALAAKPMSVLDGCAAYTFAGGTAPDAATMAAESAAATKAADLNQQATAADAKVSHPGVHASAADYARSAKESADAAQLSASAATAIADLATLREARDARLAVGGGASFGKDSLRALVAPPAVKTPEGAGAGTPLAELHQKYDAQGLKPTPAGHFAVPVPGKPGWTYDFAVADGAKVGAVSLVAEAVSCG